MKLQKILRNILNINLNENTNINTAICSITYENISLKHLKKYKK